MVLVTVRFDSCYRVVVSARICIFIVWVIVDVVLVPRQYCNNIVYLCCCNDIRTTVICMSCFIVSVTNRVYVYCRFELLWLCRVVWCDNAN